MDHKATSVGLPRHNVIQAILSNFAQHVMETHGEGLIYKAGGIVCHAHGSVVTIGVVSMIMIIMLDFVVPVVLIVVAAVGADGCLQFLTLLL